MADALGVKKNSIEKLCVFAFVALTCMEVYLEALAQLLFGCQDLLEELVDFQVVIFFVDHVKATDDVFVALFLNPLLSFDAGVEHSLNVWLSNDLEATVDDLHAEERVKGLNVFENTVEDLKLLPNCQRFSLVVEEHTENMAIFDHSDHFADVVLAGLVEDLFKEGRVIIKSVCKHKLVLESFPNFVVFGVDRMEENFVLDFLIELLSALGVLTQLVDLHVGVFVASVLGAEEIVLFFGVVHLIIVSKLNQEIDV